METPTVEPIFFRKSQLDIFGGAAPEVPKIPANPKTEKLNNLSIEHKQIYNNLLSKQKKNKLLPEESGHLKNFNQYLSGGITHEQLKGYIGYKQNENHLPLFGNAPTVPKIDAVQKPTVEPVKADTPAPTVEPVKADTPPLTDIVEPNAEKPQYPHAAFKLLSDEHDEAEGDFDKRRVVNDHAYRLGGDHNSNLRQEIMQAYTGKKVPKAQARMGHVKEAFENWIAKNKGLNKSQLSMFGDEPPKVDPIKVDTPKVEPAKIDAPKVSSVSGSENFLKPEHKLESEDGVWKVKGDSAATSQLHSWLKDKYKKKEIYTYGGLLNSGHPVADKVKELHGDDKKSIFQHFNKITGRESGRELGVGENQLRMSLKDSAGMQLGDKHFQVPDLSEKAKIERDSYPNGAALHQALNNREVSPELHKWHRDYTFNSYHKKADSGEHYERSLYNNKTEDFGKPKTKPEDNLKPKELERYNALKDAHINEPFTDTHKKRLEELTAKDNNKKHLSEKFSPEDKKVYDDILKQKEETKALIDSKDLTLAQKEPHKAKQKELHGQETEMLANYRQKLGLGRGDETGQKGFSYTEGLNDDEAKEMDHLTDKQEFTKLHSKYTQAPEENHISKLLKYPMSSNQKVFDNDNQGSKAPAGSKSTDLFTENKPASKNSAGIDDEDEGIDPEPDLTDPKQKIESHFPTTGIVSPGSFQKTLKEYGHRPQDSQRPFPANSTIEFNGEKHSIERDGGTHLMTRNLTTGKTDVIHKADVEQFPSDRKIPRIDRYSVENFMNEHGDEGLSLEDVYSKMGLPDDIKGKDHIKKKLKSALLQLEHHHETGGLHAPKVEREVGKAHPKETDEKEKGILYKLAKSMWDYAAQTISYIREKTLIKSYMIDLTIQQKEKSIFEKSLERKDIYETLMVLSEEEKSLCAILDDIQAATLMKSGIPLVKFLNDLLGETTRYVVESGSRFDLLKSMDNGGFQKAVDAAVAYDDEEEKYAIYKYIKPTQNGEDNSDAGTEE